MSRRKQVSKAQWIVILIISLGLCLLLGMIMNTILPPKTAHAEAPTVELITDPEILDMIMNGQTPEVQTATTEATTRFWMRTLWDIQEPDEVWVALTSEPNDIVALTTFVNGAIQPQQQLSTNTNFQQWELPRTLAQTTHSITAEGAHGWTNTQWDWRYSSDGPNFSVVQTADTWLAIENRTGQSFYYLAPTQQWRELRPNQLEGFRIPSLDYGQVLVRRSTSGSNAATLSWDWNGGSTPPYPAPFETRALSVSLPTLTVDTNTEFTVELKIAGNQGDKRALAGTLWFSDTIQFVSGSVIGTIAEPLKDSFQTLDKGGYIEFSGFNNTQSVNGNGVLAKFVFRSKYKGGYSGLKIEDFVFGPEESQVLLSEGAINIDPNLHISGHVESFTGENDTATGFIHQYPGGQRNRYVNADASFDVIGAANENHRLYFYPMDTSADFASVNLTDVTWAHLCELHALDPQDCQAWVMDANDDQPYDGVDTFNIVDVLYCSSFVLDIPELNSRAGQHEYQPYPLEYLPLTKDEYVVIKSAVVCDINGSRWMTTSASVNEAPTTVVGQNGQYTVTVTGDSFYGSLVALDLHGGTIGSVQHNGKELTHQNGKFIGLNDEATNEMTFHLTVEGTNEVSVISSEINGQLPINEIPNQSSMFIPFASATK